MAITSSKYAIYLIFLFISCLSLGGIFVKYSQLGPINTGVYRVLFSIPIFYFLKNNFKSENHLSLNEKFIAVFAGIFLGIDLILWNTSFSYTTIANANLLANLVPFTVVPFSFFLFKEKVNKFFFLSIVICLAGIYILIHEKISFSTSFLKGDILAIATSFFYGLFFITVYKLRKKAPFLQIMFYASFGCLIALVPAAFYLEGIELPTSFEDLWPLLGLAVISQVIGQGGLSYSLGKISANLASVLVLTQPVIAAIFAYFLFKESLSKSEILGIFIVLIGIYLANKSNK